MIPPLDLKFLNYSLMLLRREGWKVVPVVERHRTNPSVTLWGFAHILATRGPHLRTRLITVSSDPQFAHHFTRIKESKDTFALLEMGWEIEVHVWSRNVVKGDHRIWWVKRHVID